MKASIYKLTTFRVNICKINSLNLFSKELMRSFFLLQIYKPPGKHICLRKISPNQTKNEIPGKLCKVFLNYYFVKGYKNFIEH